LTVSLQAVHELFGKPAIDQSIFTCRVEHTVNRQ
jgi:hypothetical protein